MTAAGGPRFLPEMTWTEARDALSREPVGLLPVGATEAHGPHLPLHTDVYLSLELSFRVAEALRGAPEALVLPPVAFSVAECAASFPGSVTIAPEASRALLEDVVRSLGRNGPRTIALVNSHLEPEHVRVLEDVASAFGAGSPRVLFVDHRKKPWALELGDEFRGGDCHAGAYETSLLLASRYAALVRRETAFSAPPVRAGLVRHLKAGLRSFREMGIADAYCGDPAIASAETGEKHFAVLVRMWTETIRAAREAAKK